MERGQGLMYGTNSGSGVALCKRLSNLLGHFQQKGKVKVGDGRKKRMWRDGWINQ